MSKPNGQRATECHADSACNATPANQTKAIPITALNAKNRQPKPSNLRISPPLNESLVPMSSNCDYAHCIICNGASQKDKIKRIHNRSRCLTKKAEPPPINDMKQPTISRTTAMRNGGWLRRLVRCQRREIHNNIRPNPTLRICTSQFWSSEPVAPGRGVGLGANSNLAH